MSKSCTSSSWSCDHVDDIDDIDDHHHEHLLELLHCFFCLLCPQLHHSLDLILVNESISDKIKLVWLDGLRVTRLVGRNSQKLWLDILIHVKLRRTLTRRNARAVRSSASSPGSQVESWLYTWTSGPGQVKNCHFLVQKRRRALQHQVELFGRTLNICCSL